MNDIIAVMLDVAGLLTRGSDVARTEARRIAEERGHRAASNALAVADQPVAAAAPATERSPVPPLAESKKSWRRLRPTQ